MAEAAPITTTDVARSAPPIIPAERPMPEARDTTVRHDAPKETVAPPAEVKTEAKTEPVKTGRRIDTWNVKWDGIADDVRDSLQSEVDKHLDRVRKNSERRTRAEVRAFYEGRESAIKTTEQPKPQPAKQEEEKAPTRDQFEDWESYSDAKAAYVARKAVRDEQERIANERKERETAESRNQKMEDFRSKTKAKFPDIEQRIEAIGDVVLSPDVADEIASSEWGPEIMNHFIDNRQDLERISKLSVSAASRELGRLEARFESAAKKPEPAPEPPVAKPSAAPAPITPVDGGKTATATARASDKDDMATFAKKRNAEEAARRGLTA